MRTWNWVIAAGVGAVSVVLATQTVKAGAKWTNPVLIWSNAAHGTFGDARASSDSLQFLGCWLNSDGGSVWGQCNARNASGAQGSCYTSNPLLMEQIRHMPSDANVSFYWNPDGTCSGIYFSNHSTSRPKTP